MAYKMNSKAKPKMKAAPKKTRLKVKLPKVDMQSRLEKKYGKARVSRAMAFVEAETGAKKLTRPKQYEFAGELAKRSKAMGTKLSMNTANKIARRTKRKGVEPDYTGVLNRKK